MTSKPENDKHPPVQAPAGAHTPTGAPKTGEKPPLAPQGSKDYVAGQPVDEEEQAKTEGEADARRKQAEENARLAEQKAQAVRPSHPSTSSGPPDTHSKK